MQDAADASEVKVEIRGALAEVTLDRPRALNALTTAMRVTLAEAFPRFARDPQVYAVVQRSTSPKAFSAGGDIRELTQWGREDRGRARAAFGAEYRLNWLLECFSKPTVSLIDGLVMGSGVGISAFGTHRVAGTGYKFGMPETGIGLFPDVGAALLFARLPDEIGLYLGLTGRSIGRADAYALGLATHCIAAERFPEIVAGLENADPVDPLLDERHQDPGRGELEAHRAVIAHAFGAPTVEETVARLTSVRGASQAWAEGVVADLAKRSPISLKVTARHIKDAKSKDLRAVLETDYRLACRCLEGLDFYEGVRAAVIDKDGKPRWTPGRLEDVSEDQVSGYFASLGADELSLPRRDEMQAARF